MHLLPQKIDDDSYWRDVYKQPLPFWQQALREIASNHHMPSHDWERATLGRNVVFLAPTTVVKLGPPCWPGEMAREAVALQFIAGRLPVTTPVLVAMGSLDGWEYLIQERLPGTNLRQLWQQVDTNARATLAHQHGEIMAALHALPQNDLPSMLHFDWASMLTEQHQLCAREMRTSGVDARLVEQIEPYLVSTPWHVEQEAPVLLHGDLSHLNFLVSGDDGEWKITGLIDWGDVKVGPPTHECISPGAHMYRGDRTALRHWYQGYQLPDKQWTAEHQHVIMARTMLYYSAGFAKLIQSVPGASACTDWSAMASVFWRMGT